MTHASLLQHRRSGPRLVSSRGLLSLCGLVFCLSIATTTVFATFSDEAREQAHEIPSQSAAGRLYRDALAEEAQGQHNRARQTLELALEIAESDRDKRTQAILLERTALVLEALNQPISARSKLEKACELRRAARDQVGELVCLESLGPRLLDALNASKAEKAYLRVRELARKTDDPVLEAQALLGVGRSALVAHRFKPAQRDLNKAREQFEALSRPTDLARAHEALAELYRLQGDYQAALLSAQKVEGLEPTNPRAILTVLEDSLVLGQTEAVRKRLRSLNEDLLKPLDKVELQLVELALETASRSVSATERASLELQHAVERVPAGEPGRPQTEPVRRFVKGSSAIPGPEKETLSGVLAALGAERHTLSRLVLSRQLDLHLETMRKSLNSP